jgi:hypothetical protein
MARAPKGKKARKSAPVKARVKKKRRIARAPGHCPRYWTCHPRRSQGIGAGNAADAGVPRRWQNSGAAGVACVRRRRAPKAEKGTARRARAPHSRVQGHDGDYEEARRPTAAAERPQGRGRRTNGGRRGIVRPAADLRRGGFLVRISSPVFRRQYHPV